MGFRQSRSRVDFKAKVLICLLWSFFIVLVFWNDRPSTRIIIVKISDWQEESTNDEIIYLSSQEHTLSLSHSIYEFICLSLPSKRAHHSIVECNQEMIATLNQYKADHVKEENDTIDPRWAKLTEFKN